MPPVLGAAAVWSANVRFSLFALVIAFVQRKRLRHSKRIKDSDTPLIDHLVMREFVSGPPSYRFIDERVRDRKPSLRKGS